MLNIKIDSIKKPITISVDKPDAIVHLKARKTIAGDVIIYDHPDIDIVVSPRENKIFGKTSKPRFKN